MLQELFKQEKDYLNFFFDNLDIHAMNHIIDVLHQCKGSIVLSGVGKSGLVAEKISQTLTSTGTRAFFLSPSNALHGDIGIVQSHDIFMMFSKSGESDELLQLLPFVRNRGVRTIAIVGNKNSQLAKKADMVAILPVDQELCPFNLAPTTSSVAQMIFGDVMSIALMKKKQFSIEQYALNHPSGKIGRQLFYRVRDLMLTNDEIPTGAPDHLLVDCLVELSNKACGCILIVDHTRVLKGIFTDGDLRRCLQKYGGGALNIPLGELMTHHPKTVTPDTMATEALILMEKDRPVTVLPVLNGDAQVVGILKMHDLVRSGLL